MPMMPMMPMMGGAAGAAASAGAGVPTAAGGDRLKEPVPYSPERPAPSVELTDFGSDLKGLEHATDSERVAASVLAALSRIHDRLEVDTEIAVGVGPAGTVFATSDGLGFLPSGARAAAHLTPLITVVPDAFTARWIGYAQPWRPLLEAADNGLVGPFDAMVTTDPAGEAFGVLALGSEEIAAVNIAAGPQERWHFDAIDAEDTPAVLAHLVEMWGRPVQPAEALAGIARAARWTGSVPSGFYPRRWAHYLLAAAAADLADGKDDDARYLLRSALRIPEPERKNT
jgi:hypothetical protein